MKSANPIHCPGTYSLLAVVAALALWFSGCAGLAGPQPPPPPAAPKIAGVTAAGVSSTAATVSWATDVPADSQVDYGQTTSYGQSTPLNSSMVTNHSVSLSALTASTLYHYRVKSKDSSGLSTSGDFSFTTSAAPDTTPPTVSITSPSSGATVSGTVSVIATASDNVGVVGVQFQVDSVNSGAEDTSVPYTLSLDTTKLSNGNHSLAAVGRDAAGNRTTSAAVTVNVSNTAPDTTPPTVSITAPNSGATVSGTITVTATASDPDSPVAFVQFQVDGSNKGAQLTAAPYSLSLDTTTLSNGGHTLTAVAQDPAHNQGTSAPITITVSNSTSTAMGPLRVLSTNNHYFTDGSGKAILLVGSHTWDNLQDTAKISPPPAFDFNAYLSFLKAHNHNLIRLWKKELPTYCGWGGGGTWYMTPWPFPRTGPGTATDGLPKFDLSQFDQSYFDRLRARVLAARAQGMYVAVMLFDGYGLTQYRCSNDGYPFSGGNNINGISDSGGNSSQTLSNAAITAIQDAYVRKVVDTVNDLDNVLYEILDEGTPSTESWQVHMINTVRTYEATKPMQHPVGATAVLYDDPWLYTTTADWVSPLAFVAPTNNQGKVIINDSDHSYNWSNMLADGTGRQRDWVWENFASGSMAIFMDPYLVVGWPNRNSPSNCANGVCTGPPDPYWDQIRNSMGYTLTYAKKMDLAKMTPQGSLASSGFCLANPSATAAEYLVYLPSGGTVTVNLSATTQVLNVEWFNAGTGTASSGGTVTGGSTLSFTAPFSGDAVLYLKHQ